MIVRARSSCSPFLVASAICGVIFLLTACNLFKGFSSFEEKSATATPTAEADASPGAGADDAGAVSRAGSVNVRGNLPPGATSPTPGAK